MAAPSQQASTARRSPTTVRAQAGSPTWKRRHISMGTILPPEIPPPYCSVPPAQPRCWTYRGRYCSAEGRLPRIYGHLAIKRHATLLPVVADGRWAPTCAKTRARPVCAGVREGRERTMRGGGRVRLGGCAWRRRRACAREAAVGRGRGRGLRCRRETKTRQSVNGAVPHRRRQVCARRHLRPVARARGDFGGGRRK